MSAPVKTFRSQNVSVSIFQNSNGYSITCQKRYRKDGEWMTGDSFFPQEIAALATLLQLTVLWMTENPAKNNNVNHEEASRSAEENWE